MRGCWLQGEGKRIKKSNVGLQVPFSGLTKTLPTQSQHGGGLESGPGSWSKDRAEGGGSRMLSDIWWG